MVLTRVSKLLKPLFLVFLAFLAIFKFCSETIFYHLAYNYLKRTFINNNVSISNRLNLSTLVNLTRAPPENFVAGENYRGAGVYGKFKNIEAQKHRF